MRSVRGEMLTMIAHLPNHTLSQVAKATGLAEASVASRLRLTLAQLKPYNDKPLLRVLILDKLGKLDDYDKYTGIETKDLLC